MVSKTSQVRRSALSAASWEERVDCTDLTNSACRPSRATKVQGRRAGGLQTEGLAVWRRVHGSDALEVPTHSTWPWSRTADDSFTFITPGHVFPQIR